MLRALVRRGDASAAEICAELGMSQPTFSRLVRSAAGVVRLGSGRSTRYAVGRDISGLPRQIPIWRVGDGGQADEFGVLTPLHGGRYVVERRMGYQIYPDLPWFLQDMRPQGFLGRLFPGRWPELGLPATVTQWSMQHVLIAVARRGNDMVGDLIAGSESYDRFLAESFNGESSFSRDDYPHLVERQLAGDMPGSSAGGEQPKFAIRNPADEHLIVKYSPPLADGSVARRWGDLLVAEHIALSLLQESAIPAVRTEIQELNGRLYLEVHRIDRLRGGRSAFLSALALDAEFVGGSDSWTAVAQGLVGEGRLPAAQVRRIALLETFGHMIGNTDMHMGNLSFTTADYQVFTTAESYDMLPMMLAPTPRAELPRRELRVPPPRAATAAIWEEARALALVFWTRLAGDGRVSGEMHDLARGYRQTISSAVLR